MSYPLTAIAGIGPAMTARLKALGIRTTDKLLEASKTVKDRRILAQKLDIDEQTVLRWANLTDRMRIKGVREPYAELLKDAGVDTVKELKYRNPGQLARAMAEANAKRKRVRLCPRKSASGAGSRPPGGSIRRSSTDRHLRTEAHSPVPRS